MSSMEGDAARSRLAKVSGLYTASASGYEEIWAPELLPLSRRLLDELPLSSARAVLDGAAGVGTLLPELVGRSPSASVIASDLTPGMLARAPQGFSRAAGDLARLPFKDASFDVCVLAFVLFHLVDPQQGVNEAARVLASGGSIGTTTWGDENLPRAFEIWADELASAGAPPAGEIANDELVDTSEKMRSILQRAGFETVKTWTEEYRATPTPEEFMDHRTKHGQGRWRLAQLDPDSRAGCLERVRRRLEASSPEDFLEISEVIYAVGRKP